MSLSVQKLKEGILLFFLFIVLVAPAIIITYNSYTQLSKQLTDEAYTRKKSLAKLMSTAVAARLDTARDIAQVSAADIAIPASTGKWNEAIRELEFISKEFPYADRVFLTDKAGILKGIYPPSPENIGKDFSFRDWYKGVSKNWQPYASEVFKRAPLPQFNTVALAVPIKDQQGNSIGVLGLAMNLDSFYALTKEFTGNQSGFLYIINQKGQVVAHPRYPALGDIIDFSDVPVVQKIMQQQSGVEVSYNPVEKEERLAAYEIVPKYNWGVVVTEPITTAFIIRDKILRNISFVNTLGLGFTFLLSIIIIIALQKLRTSRESLRLSNERFNFVAKATEDTIYDWNLTTDELIFSEGMQKVFGYTKEQIKETLDWWSQHIHPDDLQRVNTDVDTMMKKGTKNTITMEYRFKKADGSYADVIDKAYLVRDEHDKPVRYIGVLQDITKSKQYEEELKKRTHEAERLNKIMVDRELKMIELKKELAKYKGVT